MERAMKAKYIFVMAAIILLTLSGVHAQYYFGKNKVQYSDFDWHFLQSEHFDIYFTDGGKEIATFTAQVAEDSYVELVKNLRYELVDRIKIIVYNSHNDFGQTNVDLSPPEEGVGGFTEFFKNRVVIPYEGEWEKFRHVIHHELTHAYMLQMLYGAGVQSIITGMTQLQLPLWLIEGLAEFQSRGWDIESDMFMRDATLNGYVPPIPYLNAYMAYKGGQSVLHFLADRYGQEKIGEIMGKIKINKSVEAGFRQAIGMKIEDLTEKWHRELKRTYWPDVENREEPEEFAKRLTDHREDRNFINTSPAVSNRGDKVAFISDKDDFFDIYLMSAIDGQMLGKLVRGQRAGNLEELKWLRGPNISWSPDDKMIIFTAKAGEEDALHFVDVKEAEIVKSVQLNLDGIYNSAWSPDGNQIAFMGIKDGQGDLYIYNLNTEELVQLTDDIFSNIEPRWSPDGSKLIFASDRGPYLMDNIPAGIMPFDIADMKNYDLYEITIDTKEMRRVVESDFAENTPIYSPDGKKIAFVSDRSGVSNIYIKDMETDQEWPITDVLTGVYQPSWGGEANRMAFVTFYFGGYDLFQLKNPLDIKPGDVTVEETAFVKSLKENKQQLAEATGEIDQALAEEEKKYRNFVFDDAFAQGNIEPDQESKSVFLDSSSYILPTGDYKVHNYEVKFSPDLVYGSVGYNQFFGTQGYTNILLSDVLGNHRINIAANLFGDFKNADYALSYFYLPKRYDIGGGVYHNAYYFWSQSLGWVRDRNYGLSMSVINPFNKYERISYGLALRGISRTYMDLPDDLVDFFVDEGFISPRNRYFLLNNLVYTKDTTIWGYTGPANGSRYGMNISYSPKLGKDGLGFVTLRGDYRKYFRITSGYTFAMRGAGGASFGEHPQKFFLGGLSNWLNRDYYGGLRIDKVEEIYFASFEMPLRGADYYTQEGNRFLMANLEFRFPLIRQLSMGFPLPITFFNVGGALFTDMGVAWDQGDDVQFFKKSPSGLFQTDDVFASIGFGIRLNVGFFLLRYDLAWPTNFYSTNSSPRSLWSLGADF
ncbi:BamA/TamA family outer membrane protein [candidate division KSB1 bacterium]|nr:BamA/TamA family outer membrane protein [candidate division KSB1 bacterium]